MTVTFDNLPGLIYSASYAVVNLATSTPRQNNIEVGSFIVSGASYDEAVGIATRTVRLRFSDTTKYKIEGVWVNHKSNSCVTDPEKANWD